MNNSTTNVGKNASNSGNKSNSNANKPLEIMPVNANKP